jgi:adenylate kinase
LSVILISGTPGTGKTTLASELATRIGYTFIDMGKFAEAHHIRLRPDPMRKTKIINERGLADQLEKAARTAGGKLIMASHYAEIVNPRLVDKVIVLRTHPEELGRRLAERGWTASKIHENVEAEVLGVCSHNALERFGRHRVYEIDTTNLRQDQVLRIALEILESKGQPFLIGSINWLSDLERENKLEKYIHD